MSERHTPNPQRPTDEQARSPALREIERQARLLIEHDLIGPLLRMACNAAPSSRRQRVRALYVISQIAARYPALAPFIAQAVHVAWLERLAEMLPHSHGPDDTVNSVEDLLARVVEEREP